MHHPLRQIKGEEATKHELVMTMAGEIPSSELNPQVALVSLLQH